MLLREYLRGRHKCGLITRQVRVPDTLSRDRGLAGTDVALQEPVHGVPGGHVLHHAFGGAFLGVCEFKRKTFVKACGIGAFHDAAGALPVAFFHGAEGAG